MKVTLLKRLISLALTILMIMSVFSMLNISSYAATWESEDNNSFPKADNITLNADYRGNVSYNDYSDYYKFSLNSTGYISVSFSHQMLDSSSTCWSVDLYNVNQQKLRTFYFSGNYTSETAYNLGLPSGTYYLQVYRYDYYADFIDYSIRVNFTASNYWETENNDSFTTADNLSSNTDYHGNVSYADYSDYYKFSLNSTGYISVSFSHQMLNSSSTCWSVDLYNVNQQKLRTFYFSGNYTSETAYNLGLPSGTYYLQVYRYDYYADFIDYSIRVKSTASNNWETENNDSFTTADNLSLNTDYLGNVSYDDYSDYYRVNLNSNGYLTITFSHQELDSVSSCWKVYLYDINQDLIMTYDFYGNYSWMAYTYMPVLKKGTYYIQVYRSEHYADFVDYTISADFSHYPDVLPHAWYYNAIEYVANKGYMSGYSNGNFGPGNSLKRQDFVVALANIAKADLSKYQNTTSKLKDVKKGAYYAAAVNWAVDNNIISGYQNGKFGVNDNITREQVATILYRYMGSPSVSGADSTLAKFKDVKNISSFAKTPMAWAVQKNVISGMSDGRLAPTKTASRAEIASIIMRMDQQGLFK